MAAANDKGSTWGGSARPGADGHFDVALGDFEAAVLAACADQDPWPAQVAAGVYAGVDFVIENRALAQSWVVDAPSNSDFRSQYEWVIARLTQLIRSRAPVGARLPASSDEALVAGIVGLVGDHIRIGRLDRLAGLRPELVQLALLPYLGFTESQRWANKSADL